MELDGIGAFFQQEHASHLTIDSFRDILNLGGFKWVFVPPLI